MILFDSNKVKPKQIEYIIHNILFYLLWMEFYFGVLNRKQKRYTQTEKRRKRGER